jgi:hypothetical protein
MRIDGEAIAKMRLRRRLEDQGGFTLAEVLVAGLILVVALIPIVRMFDTSFAGIMASSKVHKSVTLGQKVMEEIKSMPFYVPYDDAQGKTDIDDHFWGERNPVNSNPENASGPDWDGIPEVVLTRHAYGQIDGYDDFRTGVKLCYQNDATSVSEMKENWGPMKVGNDRPKDSDNRGINLLVVQVNVYTMKEGVETREHQVEAIVTATEAVYNLGVSRINVDGPEDVLGTRSDAAAHWPDKVVNVTIEGWGFNPSAPNFEVSLVRPDYKDIRITVNPVTSTDTVIKGTVRLYNSTAGSPWRGRAPIGYWSVKVRQDITSTYLYNGFICEYPGPVISNYGNDPSGPYNPPDMSKVGYKGWGSLHLKVQGGCFVNVVENPTIRLIEDVEEDPYVATGTITSITAPDFGYSSSGCEIKATFDIAEAPVGDYMIEVINTQPEVVGHVSSKSGIYRIEETPEWVATIDDFQPDLGNAFYENYFDIPSTITGTDLAEVRKVFIRNTDGVEYEITGDCMLGGDTQIPVNLNLVGCDNLKDWELRAYHVSGAYINRSFDITLGPAKILPPDNNTPSIRIYAEKALSAQWNNETVAARAWAWSGSWFFVWIDGYATFQVRGEGFPMSGQTNLRVWGTDLNVNGNFGSTYDRANKTVMIQSSRWMMPRNRTGNYNIEVNRVGDPDNKDTHLGRWELRS